MPDPGRHDGGTLVQLREGSLKALHASEQVVERGFHEARLTASLVLALLLVGFLLVAQWRGQDTASRTLEQQSDTDLAIIIDQINTENTTLREEVLALQARVLDAERATADRTEVLSEATRELNSLRVLAGLEAAHGEGLVIEIRDPQHVLIAQDFVSLVHELRAAGAEAIAINDIRLDARTGLGGDGGRITVGGRSFTEDYEVLAIGSSADLEQALMLPGGVRATMTTFPGVTVDMDPEDDVYVPARDMPVFVYGESVYDK